MSVDEHQRAGDPDVFTRAGDQQPLVSRGQFHQIPAGTVPAHGCARGDDPGIVGRLAPDCRNLAASRILRGPRAARPGRVHQVSILHRPDVPRTARRHARDHALELETPAHSVEVADAVFPPNPNVVSGESQDPANATHPQLLTPTSPIEPPKLAGAGAPEIIERAAAQRVATRGSRPVAPRLTEPTLELLARTAEGFTVRRRPNLRFVKGRAGVVFGAGSGPARAIPMLTVEGTHAVRNHRPGVVHAARPQVRHGFDARLVPD